MTDSVYVTQYYDADAKDVFIRVNQTHFCAVQDALADLKESLKDYKTVNGQHEIDVIEREDDSPSVVRIINPNNGFEYEAFIITEELVGD